MLSVSGDINSFNAEYMYLTIALNISALFTSINKRFTYEKKMKKKEDHKSFY